ncbi:DUF6415 family natural product biosynthesis protein [Streptomyces sp. NPDC048650]|uniref:DUF6415 family natural product biosynthesis protein n=1 Tax=Streptomyces sp. NPDC048650 TaxID=3365583 RepID=UPI00371B8FF7
MAALTPTVPDKVEIRALAKTALAWKLDTSGLPTVEDALSITERFTGYGRTIANDLCIQCLSLPADSGAARSAQVTLGEASRRLYLDPLAGTASPWAAAHRAQNLARLVTSLLRAAGAVSEELVRITRQQSQGATMKGTQ